MHAQRPHSPLKAKTNHFIADSESRNRLTDLRSAPPNQKSLQRASRLTCMKRTRQSAPSEICYVDYTQSFSGEKLRWKPDGYQLYRIKGSDVDSGLELNSGNNGEGCAFSRPWSLCRLGSRSWSWSVQRYWKECPKFSAPKWRWNWHERMVTVCRSLLSLFQFLGHREYFWYFCRQMSHLSHWLSLGVYQTYYEQDLLRTESSSRIAWIGSIQAFLFIFGGVLAGPLYDYGYLRTLLCVGSFLIVFGMMMTSLCLKYWQFVLAQGLIVGLGNGCLFVPSVAVLPTYFLRWRALVTGIAITGGNIGWWYTIRTLACVLTR